MSDTEELRLARRVLDRVGDRGEAQVRVGRSRHGLTRFANSFIHQHVGEDTATADLLVVVDGRVASASTCDLRDEALTRFVDEALEMARVQPPDPNWPGLTKPVAVHGTDRADDATEAADPDQRARLVRDFVDAAKDLRAAGYVDSEGSRVAYANSTGHSATGRITRATVDGIHQTPTSAGSAHQTSTRLADLDATAAGVQAAERAQASAQFVDLDPGDYEVVLGPECVATMALFLSLYGFNAKAHLEGQSFARVGEAQFDPALTLVDDPDDARAIGLPFDVEGTPKRALGLVEAGTTANLAHDRRTARRAQATSTGHAIPGGESMGPIPTNLVVRAGTTPRARLVDEVDRGLLVSQFHYCRVLDPKTMVVTGLTRNGTFLVEDGEIAGAVGNLRFTQSFLDALAPGQILGVGDDDRHADSEFGPGMAVAPSMRLAQWRFTGGARG